MLDTKEQKRHFITIMVLILILGLVSFWHKPNFQYKDTTDYTKVQQQDFLTSKAYLDYLNSLPVDPKASQELFQTILTKEDIKKEVEATLKTDQKITPPSIDSKNIKVAQNTGSQQVSDYLTNSISQSYSFGKNTSDLAQSIFSGDTDIVAQMKSKLSTLTGQLYDMNVPKDAVALHKALLTAYSSYNDLLDAAKNYDPIDYTKNDAVWPQVYKDYVVANDSTKAYGEELNKLASKYQISYINLNYYADAYKTRQSEFTLIPKAQAFLGIGDITFSTTIGDIPRYIMDGIKEGVKSSFLQFTGNMLNKFIAKIEQNYIVANFLYYSDALVNGQYADDYLAKYVSNTLDRVMIKNFIPQFSCGQQPQNMKALFQAKASQQLGFDPESLDPRDPNYYQKMASVGNFLSSPSGWQLYYQDMAAQAQSEAEKAAEKELTSSGLKTPRSTIQSSISSSINSIVSAERASFTALIQLGISNADSIISSVVGKLTESLLNQFVFRGVVGNNGSIAVLKEQPTCVSAAVLNPILALPNTNYQNPPPAMTADQAMAQQCSYLNTLSSSCTSATLNTLQGCANNPSQATQQMCSNVANSTYINTMLQSCRALPSSYCTTLQNLLQRVH